MLEVWVRNQDWWVCISEKTAWQFNICLLVEFGVFCDIDRNIDYKNRLATSPRRMLKVGTIIVLPQLPEVIILQGHWSCWGHWDHWGCRGFKAWKLTTEDFRVIQAFEFSFIFIFWKKKFFWVESWNIILNFSTFSVGGCWGKPKLLFFKLVLIIKMSASQDFKTAFKYNLTCIFLSLRAKLKKPLCPRTPCSMTPIVSNKVQLFTGWRDIPKDKP